MTTLQFHSQTELVKWLKDNTLDDRVEFVDWTNNSITLRQSEMPIIEAVRTPGNRLRFFCKYCKVNHTHGIGNGHRLAHCISHTPYKKTGYIIVEYPATAETKKKLLEVYCA